MCICLYVCVYVFVCVYMCVCSFMCVFIHMCVSVCVFIRACMCVCVCVCVCLHAMCACMISCIIATCCQFLRPSSPPTDNLSWCYTVSDRHGDDSAHHPPGPVPTALPQRSSRPDAAGRHRVLLLPHRPCLLLSGRSDLHPV